MVRILLFIILIPYNAVCLDIEANNFLRTSKQCSFYFDYYEKLHGIPKHLLSSIAIRETGRWDKYNKKLVSWPWSVNQSGNSNYFKTKNEAMIAVKKHIIEGKTNIDVGCMQINLRYHPKAFNNLFQALEPRNNIEYAADFLKKLYNKYSSWHKAIAAYHSNSELGMKYAEKVIKIWKKIRASEEKTKRNFNQQIKNRKASVLNINNVENKYNSKIKVK